MSIIFTFVMLFTFVFGLMSGMNNPYIFLWASVGGVIANSIERIGFGLYKIANAISEAGKSDKLSKNNNNA